MIYKIKRFSLSPRTKEGLRGARRGALGGLGFSSALGLFYPGKMSTQGRLVLSIVTSILTAPFMAMSEYGRAVKEYDKKAQSNKEGTKNCQQEELKKSLLSKFPEVTGISKVSDEVKKFRPNFGDGDEYPVFSLNFSPTPEKDFLPVLSIDYQREEIGLNLSKGWWCTEDKPGNKINLKQHLLKEYENYLKEYTRFKSENSFGWEPDEYDKVIKFIKETIKSIKKNL